MQLRLVAASVLINFICRFLMSYVSSIKSPDILAARSRNTNKLRYLVITKLNKFYQSVSHNRNNFRHGSYVLSRCVEVEFLLVLSRLLHLACNVNNEVMEVYYLTSEDPHVAHVWSVIRIRVHPRRLTYCGKWNKNFLDSIDSKMMNGSELTTPFYDVSAVNQARFSAINVHLLLLF